MRITCNNTKDLTDNNAAAINLILQKLSECSRNCMKKNELITSLLEFLTCVIINENGREPIYFYYYRFDKNSSQFCFVQNINTGLDAGNDPLPDHFDLEELAVYKSRFNHIEINRIKQEENNDLYPGEKLNCRIGIFFILCSEPFYKNREDYEDIKQNARSICTGFLNSLENYNQLYKLKEISKLYIDEEIGSKFEQEYNTELKFNHKNQIHYRNQIIKPEKKQLVILNMDIADYTSFSEKTGDPEELLIILNKFIYRAADIIKQYNGIIDQFMGDGILAWFGFHSSESEGVLKAALCAREIVKELDSALKKAIPLDDPLAKFFSKHGIENSTVVLSEYLKIIKSNYDFKIRIGIDIGEVCIGHIGGQARGAYTAIGRCVNHAVRLQSLGKTYGVSIIVSREFKEILEKSKFPDKIKIRQLAYKEIIKGIDPGMDIFQILSPLDNNKLEFYKCYKEALEHYHNKTKEDITLLSDLLMHMQENALDIPAIRLIEKIFARIQEKIKGN